MGSSLPQHLAEIPNGEWSVWRSLVLRGAGVPARLVLQLSDLAVCRACEAFFAAESEWQASRRSSLASVSEALDALRAAGRWSDKDRRRPLLKTLRKLSKGLVPAADGLDAEIRDRIGELPHRLEQRDRARERFEAAYEDAVRRISEQIRELSRSDRIREAMIWQNRAAAVTVLEHLGSKSRGGPRSSRARQHEELFASYLQRYCVKNDTIGFFGPVSWSRITDRETPVHQSPGESLVDQRRVYFEHWAIERVAQALEQPEHRPFLCPTLMPYIAFDAGLVRRPFAAPLKVDEGKSAILELADGTRTALEIATRLSENPGSCWTERGQVLAALDELCRGGILSWRLTVPLDLHPERRLSEALERIAAPDLRREALDAVRALERDRDAVADSAGNSEALAHALEALETTFTRLTRSSPSRRAGRTYAARGLVYEYCTRSGTYEFGPQVLEKLGPPLELVLIGARWLAGDLNRRCNEALRSVYGKLRSAFGGRPVDSHSLLLQAVTKLFVQPKGGPKRRPEFFERSEEEFHRRWSAIIGPEPVDGDRSTVTYRAEELEPAVREAFGSPGPTWDLARYFSPDVMICAEGDAAFREGNYTLVLSEIHCSNSLGWSCFVSQHPDPDELLANLDRDLRDRAAILVPQIRSTDLPQRMNISLILPRFQRLMFADEPPSLPECQAIASSRCVIDEIDGRLVLRDLATGLVSDATELFNLYLTQECSRILGSLLPPARHRARIVVDDVVIAREAWRFHRGDFAFVDQPDAASRFLEGRRWAAAEKLPRFCFYKLSSERKPCFIDWASPIYVDILSRLIRGAEDGESVTLSEMLPGFGQLWLNDSEGQSYTCELRMAALETATP
ncbi:MAG: lantibiotic dehydratase [bacterium]